MIKIIPSTNPCDENALLDYAKQIQSMGLEYIQCDVMDGEFVPNKCLSIEKIAEIRDNTALSLDVHLMVANPIKVIQEYIDLRPNIVTFHIEALHDKKQVLSIIKKLHKAGIWAGIAIKPDTVTETVIPYLPLIDCVLVMSVEPGRSGQEYIKGTEEKVKTLKSIINKNNLCVKIEIDGGIKDYMVHNLAKAGVDYFVIGSAFYKSKDKEKFLQTCNN